MKIKSVSESFPNKNFPYPFKHSTPGDIKSFACFFDKYLAAIDSPFSDLFGFWHKVNRAWQSGIENASLSLGVAIEGILKTYFGEHGLPDDEIAQQANAAKEILGGLDLGARIRDRLFGSIGGLLNNSSPKSSLYHLAQDGIINKSMAGKWVKLRNKSVHPDKLNEDPQAFQKYIDLNYTCIALLFLLLFSIIEYEGNYIDYSADGWPEKKVKEEK